MEKVRIQDDLYNYVNGEKIESLVIPDDLPSIGGFTTLHTEVEALMIGEFNRMSDTGDYPDDYLRRACALFAAAKNVEKKAADGVAPLLKDLALIEGLKDMDDFNAALKELVLSGMPLPLEISVETDMKNTKVHGVNFQGPGVILPDTSYYKPEMAPQKEALLGIWSAMAQAVLAKSDLSEEAQAQYIQDTLAFDAILGGLVKSQEEWSEYIKAYNPRKTSTVCKMVAPIDLKGLL
ncbi:MAG: M13 family peptidase, partial [Clostridia bacterium]|nr:M13 family peptidase [Clostridia bacterium]